MIELDRHIEILLLSNDCVIVPCLGGFVASHVSARYDDNDNMFIPPLRTLGFNAKLNVNDSLLVQSYAETYDISYPEAYTRIENEVNELKQHLANNGSFMLNGIGTLYMNKEGNTLGTALNLLVQKTEAKDAVERRFQSVATATQMQQLSNHMRAIVQLLRAENIPLDYPCLAKDLYLYQFPQAVSSIRLRWGQDFYSVKLPE